jgi:hypothetical protein
MVERTERPRRKRLSWESRCEIVWLIEQGCRRRRRRGVAGRVVRRVTGFGAGTRRVAGRRCVIAARGRIGSLGGCRRSRRRRSSRCGDGVRGRRCGLRGCSRIRPQRSARWYDGTAAPVCHGCASSALGSCSSVSGRASCFASTRRSWAAFGRLASARSAITCTATAAPAGRCYMSRSMTTRGSRTPRSCPANALSTAAASSTARSTGTARRALGQREGLPQQPLARALR